MDYEMEELIPIVAELAAGFTSNESSSITYEHAEQLMQAVLYTISQCEIADSNAVTVNKSLSAKKAYSIGGEILTGKVKASLALFNSIMNEFESYGNICLNDTVAKGIPEFFKWYNVRYKPQDELLTLDYPVLPDLMGWCGIDKIERYLKCIYIEQTILNRFDKKLVLDILSAYDREYRYMLDNLTEVVFLNVICHFLIGKAMSEPDFTVRESEALEGCISKMSRSELKNKLEQITIKLTEKYYDNSSEVLMYLMLTLDNLSIRLKNNAYKCFIR